MTDGQGKAMIELGLKIDNDSVCVFKSGFLCLCLHKVYLVENSEKGSGMVSGMKRNGWCGRSQDLKSI